MIGLTQHNSGHQIKKCSITVSFLPDRPGFFIYVYHVFFNLYLIAPLFV
jgi:hypothetical protein